MDSNSHNFPSENYKKTAKKAGPQNRRFYNNSSPSYSVVSPKGKSQTGRPATKDFTVTRRQPFFCSPHPSDSRIDWTEFPSKLNENIHLPPLNTNQRYRSGTFNNSINTFEPISDENCVYENLDFYWKQPYFHAHAQNTITYTTPSELFVSEDRRKTLSKDTTKMSDSSRPWPPPLPAKFKRERFAFRMSGGISEVDSSSTCSQEQTSISNDSDVFSTEDSISSADSDSKIYVNLAEVRSSLTPTKTLQSVSEALMADQGKAPETKYHDDSQPPPLPKKTLNRTNSAPGGALVGSSMSKSLPCSPGFQISNPLYGIYEGKMILRNKTSFSTPSSPLSTEEKFSAFNRRSVMVKARSLDGVPSYVPQVDMEKLTFQMSDLELWHWINFESQEDIFRKLAYRCMMSLRGISAKYASFFVKGDKSMLMFSESNWPDFKLSFDKPCCYSRDAVYYRAQYNQDPQEELTLKVSKTLNEESPEMEPSGLSVQKSLPVHFNVQQVRGHFVATIPTNLSPAEDAAKHSNASETEVANDEPSASTDNTEANSESNVNSRRQHVIIMQETPHQTMADFVNESASIHESQADVYERHICLLLLQLCLGLEHLKSHGVTHCDLRLENLLLVEGAGQTSDPGSQAQSGSFHLPQLIISNFSKAKQKSAAADQRLHPDQARLAPEMSSSQYKMVDEFQLGILIYEVLHMSNPFENMVRQQEDHEYSTSDLPQIRPRSTYSEGLQHLAHLLLRADPNKRIHIRQAKGILQALLWGPCSKLFSVHTGLKDPPNVLKNWLDVKRILLALKFSEGFCDEQKRVTLEDWLCCQYFALTSPESVYQAVEELQILLEEAC
ncbi:inactive tyrosine-protein kinase PEAK1 [Hypanus sabinus]|uniref:inactive tyrosine-protein kinase PEAK1 n=1 Tax=Hypanus sabinus TaxID=79690 RepID=UPI0028C4E230|nr:inactive tyrosine-protein kinase PEAK1 [Hypanus sabinus]